MTGGPFRFLFDEHLPVVAARTLADRGIDAVHSLDVGLRGVADPRVFEYARERGRIVVTRNYADFGALVEAHNRRGTASPGVLFVPSSLRQGDVGGHVTAVEDGSRLTGGSCRR